MSYKIFSPDMNFTNQSSLAIKTHHLKNQPFIIKGHGQPRNIQLSKGFSASSGNRTQCRLKVMNIQLSPNQAQSKNTVMRVGRLALMQRSILTSRSTPSLDVS
jgi:hypothetical protein